MIAAGITGGIGSGKSTVCRLLEEKGIPVFYADLEARRLMVADERVRCDIVDEFGEQSYRADGSLDRPYLASAVFGDEKRLARLDAIVHPRVYEAFDRFKTSKEKEGFRVVVLEAALIFESGGDRYLDLVVVVDAPEKDRINRVMERDGISMDQVRARIRHQISDEERLARADYVISNTGTPADLERQVEVLFERLTEGSGRSRFLS